MSWAVEPQAARDILAEMNARDIWEWQRDRITALLDSPYAKENWGMWLSGPRVMSILWSPDIEIRDHGFDHEGL